MTEKEFIDVALNPLITKYLAVTGGHMQGLSVITQRLEQWPLIAPEYFERHFPGQYAARRIFYVGFVAVKPEGRTQQLFPRIIRAMYGPVIAVNGIAVMDFCAINVDAYDIPKATTMILQRLNPLAGGHMLDRQEFWAWDFEGQL
jgi:hypothetical protein